jgi:plasmid stabilization system protein ParE
VARLEIALKTFDDFDRFVAHMERFAVPDPPARIAEIVEALQLLIQNPTIGRPVPGGKRELLIGTGSHGYVALYRFAKKTDTVIVLTMRSQREGGYKRGG